MVEDRGGGVAVDLVDFVGLGDLVDCGIMICEMAFGGEGGVDFVDLVDLVDLVDSGVGDG